jgi:branched-chain amino acid transport system ATP-binding protein
MTELLASRGLYAGYHGRAVVEDINLSVSAGQVVAVLGANGAGKTTLLNALAGAQPVLAGDVRLNGAEMTSPLHVRARRGLAYVADDRSVFMDLTVGENLRIRGEPELALELFPELRMLWKRRVGLLSGGEQQMLAVGRAVACKARVLMVDELSLGLAPLIVQRLLQAIRAVADSGAGVLVVEQHVRQVLEVADFAYVLRRGHVALEGAAQDMRARIEEIEGAYLVVAPEAMRPGQVQAGGVARSGFDDH